MKTDYSEFQAKEKLTPSLQHFGYDIWMVQRNEMK